MNVRYNYKSNFTDRLWQRKKKTAHAYELELKRMVEARTGVACEIWLMPQVRATAANMVMIDRIQDELLESDSLTDLRTGSMGQQKIEVTPLLPPLRQGTAHPDDATGSTGAELRIHTQQDCGGNQEGSIHKRSFNEHTQRSKGGNDMTMKEQVKSRGKGICQAVREDHRD